MDEEEKYTTENGITWEEGLLLSRDNDNQRQFIYSHPKTGTGYSYAQIRHKYIS